MGMGIESSLSSISRVTILQWCICFLLLCCFPISIFGGYERDREALLAIKSQITDDPLGVMSSWNNSVDLCKWQGVSCGRRHPRVTVLDLSNQYLGGTLSPHIGNLSFLRKIVLDNNSFHGVIPPEIGRLSRLVILCLSNNTFGGNIPANLSHCSNLIAFEASSNNLVGNIPKEIGNLLKLRTLYISFNELTGHLPASLGNISTLEYLYVGTNKLQGRLPDTLGLLKRLVHLVLQLNYFSGLFPPSIYNITSLELLALVGNQLSGIFPVTLGSDLPNLRRLLLGGNNFSGTLPESLSNATKLEILDAPSNHFTGKVSINFQNAKNLFWFSIGENNLGSGSVGDLDFITTLTNCSNLRSIDIFSNQFGGSLPNSITNLSTSLEYLYLAFNQITGSIPSGISNLVNLIGIGFEDNRLTGTIPNSLGKLRNLQGLALGTNALTGRIPTILGNLSKLFVVGLEENLLEGSIPAEFGKCQNLIKMLLDSNRLTGLVPKEIFNIVTLSRSLNLSNNLLIGSLPSQVGNMKNLVQLDISRNNFSGQIPSTLGGCTSLETLYLGNNNFHGSIPASLRSLKSIATLDLSNNNLSGQIPEYLGKLSFLKHLNLSYNNFEGQVPIEGVFRNVTGIMLSGNERLCGGIAELNLPLCPFNKSKEQKPLKLILIVCGVLGMFLLSSLIFCLLRNRRVKTVPSSTSGLGNSVPMVSFQQLLKATDGFASTNLIGQGSFGRVYKGILDQNQEGHTIAVKVMNLQEEGASKSFLTECKTLRNVRHRNLVKIISACSSIDFQGNPFKALIYEFMSNGSLEQWLHGSIETSGEPKMLNFRQRLNIAIDVASALDYLHHHCEVPIVHCDLKPSNILLNHDMVAHVGDFGLARFFPKSMNNYSGNTTSTIGLKGTIGYAAPEYGIGTEATTSGDMYSFGILLLEMFTRKRPTNEMFKDGLTLHHFVKMALPDQLLEVVDPLLVVGDNEEDIVNSRRNPSRADMEETKRKEYLISILKVGIACSLESPKDRMDIKDAAKDLYFMLDKYIKATTRTRRTERPYIDGV